MPEQAHSERLNDTPLIREIRQLIETARTRAAVSLNADLAMLHWQVGCRIHREVLGAERADYGEEIVSTLSRQLTLEYGGGFSRKNLHPMVRFAQAFDEEGMVSTLSRELSWSHLKEPIYLDEPLKRDFYVALCRLEGWRVRQLRERMQSLLFERSSLSKRPDETIRHDLEALRQDHRPSPELLLKEPYLLDFLGLQDRYLERDLEDAILREIELFLLELGAGFTFVARQKRLQIDHDDFYVDLLFYNRKLRRLVAIDLKVGEFRPEFKGQMELYLRWLTRHEQEADENPPLGIILCAGKKQEQIELLELYKSWIHVAEYRGTCVVVDGTHFLYSAVSLGLSPPGAHVSYVAGPVR